jgi:hypothetical protein
MGVLRLLVPGIVVVGLLAGCGSNDPTAAAKRCFENALASQSIHSGSNTCADATAYKIDQQGSGTKFSVTCTHKAANQYICNVTGPATQSASDGGTGIVQGGFYNVTYDGKSIVYQQTQ